VPAMRTSGARSADPRRSVRFSIAETMRARYHVRSAAGLQRTIPGSTSRLL
jgi:hypothetical protein